MENKLPPDFKKKWLEALRSGEYKQGIGTLYNEHGNEYCCLGVACKIAHPEVIPPDSEFISNEYHKKLPNVPTVLLGEDETPRLLANMNDGVKLREGKILQPQHNFLEIADWIENNL